MMQYRITLDVFELQGITVNDTGSKNVNWTLVSTFHLSPSRTVSRSKSGRVSRMAWDWDTHIQHVHCIKCFFQTLILVVHAGKSCACTVGQ